MKTYQKSFDFFEDLVKKCSDDMDDVGWMDEELKKTANAALEKDLSWNEFKRRIERFFKEVRKKSYYILFILDEFDEACVLFKNSLYAFMELRELSYNPEYQVVWITASRRSLSHIEVKSNSGSTLAGIFHSHYLAMFKESEIKEYFSRVNAFGIEMTPSMQEQILYYCGGHPFFLGKIGFLVLENFRYSKKIDIDEIACFVESDFITQYDRMTNILEEKGSLQKLLQILFGPIIDANQNDVKEFLRYGIIQTDEDGQYTGFSNHFQTYLRILDRNTELESIFKKTEQGLRQIITKKMIDKYKTDEWITEWEKGNTKMKIFENARSCKQNEMKNFGNQASSNLLDYTYTGELFQIILRTWDIFEPILGKDKSYWNSCSNMISKIRTPLAHNRIVPISERKVSEGYCFEILEILKKQGIL